MTRNSKQIEPDTARWKALVEEGSEVVALVEQDKTARNWILGDAALEIAPMGSRGHDNGGFENLQRYAEEVGVSFESLRSYRQTAAAWPKDTRVSFVSHKVHSLLAKPENQHLIVPGMTVTGAHKALGQSTAGRTGPRSDTSAKVEQAKSLLEDPEVADEVYADRGTRRKAQAAVERARQADPQEQEMADRVERAKQRDEESRRKAHTFRFIQSDADLTAAKKSLRGALDHVRGVEFSNEERDLLTEEIAAVRDVLNLVDLAVTGTSDVDWDAEFAKIGGDPR